LSGAPVAAVVHERLTAGDVDREHAGEQLGPCEAFGSQWLGVDGYDRHQHACRPGRTNAAVKEMRARASQVLARCEPSADGDWQTPRVTDEVDGRRRHGRGKLGEEAFGGHVDDSRICARARDHHHGFVVLRQFDLFGFSCSDTKAMDHRTLQPALP